MCRNLQRSKPPLQDGSHVRARKMGMHNRRRSSGDTCSTEASVERVLPEKDANTRHSLPALLSNSSASHLSSGGDNYEPLAQKSPLLSTAGSNHFADSGSISLDPPVTKAVLSEIDIPQLEDDLLLRHHLNFDPTIQLRINMHGQQVEERRKRALEYWHALAVEIELWLVRCQRTAACPSSRPLCISLPRTEATSFAQGAILRLPRLLGAVRDILKHLLPSEEWPVIDARLDVRLLMQQLEHRICDFTALSDWLGNFLKPFCSPTRGDLLLTMSSTIRFGVENAEIKHIITGLKTMFAVLEGINLVS